MTLLPPQAIDDFQALWKKHYGIDLSREEAVARAHQVFSLVGLLTETPPPRRQPGAPDQTSVQDHPPATPP